MQTNKEQEERGEKSFGEHLDVLQHIDGDEYGGEAKAECIDAAFGAIWGTIEKVTTLSRLLLFPSE